jgi:predicted amidohydrolase
MTASVLTLDLVTFDPGMAATDVCAFANAIVKRVEESWDGGADMVLLPEFAWVGLEPLLASDQTKPLRRVAEVFWNDLMPEMTGRLSRQGKAVVLGTAPCLQADGSLSNRAIIFADGELLYQDKLHLTPWESAFTPGQTLYLWTFSGFRIAVIICLDIEIPELSTRLRDAGVDLILCPSATETILGVERVNRCASARAVELGCYVGVSHLTGRTTSDLIDDNIGRAALYRPSQAAFQELPRNEETAIHSSGSQTLSVRLDRRALEVMRRMIAETNPSHLGRKMAGIERMIRVESAPQS